ncbi:putative bifunctional diguanylate cyclase/phosphodiesterase [Lapillicoccus jejuensis]|uniref:putative bifunctional diguanylate cyclase/phosphodiesterase n=1 Tax=Lapillicoccus jejuensis TaxID=402171 RepID=UPI001476A76C|nr:EAL domain-containing protein [Lapillicoccus jejuensis]
MVLVLVPLVGVCVAAGFQVHSSLASQDIVAQADQRIRAAVAVGLARSDLQQEVMPALMRYGVRHPEVLTEMPTSWQLQQVSSMAVVVDGLRSTTDTAVAALAQQLSVRALVPSLQRDLEAARADLDGEHGVPDTRAASALLVRLGQQESKELGGALAAGLTGPWVRAVQDTEMAARASQTAALELPGLAYMVAKVGLTSAESRSVWTQAWAAATDASSRVLDGASPELARAWQQAGASPEVAGYTYRLATLALADAAPSLTDFIGLLTPDQARNTAYQAVLKTALVRAEQAAATQGSIAQRAEYWTIGVLIGLVLLTVGAAVVIGRLIDRPLTDLAGAARRISAGELPTVAVRGPREVQTVAAALDDTVTGLRRVQEQAAQVAAGHLDSPVLASAVPGRLGEVMHTSARAMIEAIQDREKAQAQLAFHAAHDALTELPNRVQCMLLLDQALHRGTRAGTMTAVLFIDLDHFKAVNDTHGHAAGDVVLRTVSERMRDQMRASDTVFRLGGDEFVMLVEDVADEADTIAIGERLIAALEEDIAVDADHRVNVSASIGIAFCADSAVGADQLLSEADAAAYRSKTAGRGRVEVFDDLLRTELGRRFELEKAIRAGLAAGEFFLHYQPVIELSTGSPVGVEALIRWDRPGYGVLAPDTFIPLAERSTLVNEIGRWVLAEATAQLARWDAADTERSGLTMAVNVSGRHLATPGFVDDVVGALRREGIDPPRLVVEITETVLVDDPVCTTNMRTLRALGVQIAIDDFGTGYTSIGQLPHLPVDTLKIDRSFVASADPAHQSLVRLMAAAAHAFGLTVIAEGVELPGQENAIRSASVDAAQGFLYGRPVSAQEPLPAVAAAEVA